MTTAIDILKAMKRKAEIKRWTGCGYMIDTLDEAIQKIEALGDGEYLEEIIENMNIPLAITNCGEHNGGSKWEIRTTPYEKGEGKTLKEAILSLKLKLLHKQ